MEFKGSRTEKNLLGAFAGESQARNRYTFFASKARSEGYRQISEIFAETANQEKEHAERFFKFLQGGEVEITVADDGPGVPEADRERIFDLYHTSRPDGTGLGLSLANQMAGALSGTLILSDEAGLSGRGARFVLRLPRGRSAP